MDLRLKAASHYAVIQAALRLAESELLAGVNTAQEAGEHDIAARVQGLLGAIRRAHQAGDGLARAIAALPSVGGSIDARSGGSTNDKDRDDGEGNP